MKLRRLSPWLLLAFLILALGIAGNMEYRDNVKMASTSADGAASCAVGR